MGEPSIPFETSKETYRGGLFLHFRVGTCRGLWRTTDDAYEILTVLNEKKANGHFSEAMKWFEQGCRRDRKSLLIREVWNLRLAFILCRNGFKHEWWFNWRKPFV
jgi:hypothetical protein